MDDSSDCTNARSNVSENYRDGVCLYVISDRNTYTSFFLEEGHQINFEVFELLISKFSSLC